MGQVSRETAKFAQGPQGSQMPEGAVFHMKRGWKYRRLPTCGYGGGGVVPQVENLRYWGCGVRPQVANLRLRGGGAMQQVENLRYEGGGGAMQ